MAETYKELLDGLTTSTAVSAQKAVDYLDGNQLVHFKEYLSTAGSGIKDWEKRGVLPLWENITGLIIDRSAQTYQKNPERIVLNADGSENEAGTEAYNQLLEKSNADEVFCDADMLTRLLKTSVVIGQFSDERDGVYFSAMSRHNSDCNFNREANRFDSLIYTSGGIGPNGGELYHFWDGEKVIDVEVDGQGGMNTTNTEPNPYGIVPSAALFDIRPPRSGFWSKPVWEQLINFNNGVNLYHTEMKFNQRFQSLGMLVTNGELSDSTVYGPDTIAQIKQDNPEVALIFEFKSPSISTNIDAFGKWLDSFRENVGNEWGVNIRTAGEGSADSGFKLVVEELPGLQLRQKRHKPADSFEQDIYKVCLQLSRVHKLGLVEGTTLKVDFGEPDLPVNQKERAEIEQMDLGAGLANRRMIWKQRDPSLSQEDLDRMEAEIDGVQAAPDFGGIT